MKRGHAVEKRADRIQRERRKKKVEHKQRKLITSGIAVSSLLMVNLAQVTGDTYGAFSDTENASTELKACEVFPKTIETLFTTFISHTDRLIELEKQIYSTEVQSITFGKNSVPSDGDSETLRSIANSLSESINTYSNERVELAAQLAELKRSWEELNTQSNEISLILQEIQFNKYHDPNCIELNNDDLFNQIEEKILSNQMIDETLKNKVIVMFNEYKNMKNISNGTEIQLAPSIQLAPEFLLSMEKISEFEELVFQFEEQDKSLLSKIEEITTLQKSIIEQANKKKQEEDEKQAEEERLKQDEADKKAEEERLKQEAEVEKDIDVETPVEEPIEVAPIEEEIKEEPVEEPIEESPTEEPIEGKADTEEIVAPEATLSEESTENP